MSPVPPVTHLGALAFGWRDGWRYGLMGLPLAFVALPLYVLLPNHYARAYGVPLASLGLLLLAARLLDAFIDPLLGRWGDRLFARSVRAVLAWAALAAVGLGLGFALLFFPPAGLAASWPALLLWAGLCLLLTYTGYSALSVLHQAWGAMLGGDARQRSRVVAWREGLGLSGVLLAAISPQLWGLPTTTALLFLTLALGWLAWRRSPWPLAAGMAPGASSGAGPSTTAPSLWLPWQRPGFRPLLAVFVVNGIASAVPATLILFFVQDRLQAAPALEPLFLGAYFACAALAMPLWLRAVAWLGLLRAWRLGMGLSVAVFVLAAQLGAGDTMGFLLVCALSGAALGADLSVPGALLAGLIQRNGDLGRAEGAYFGWWNFATKLNLALAAGLALPLLAVWGYLPGTRDSAALHALTWAYCLLPCALKLLAAGMLSFLLLPKDRS